MSAVLPSHHNAGLKYSGALHVLLILIAFVGMPKWFRRTEDLEPQVMTVDILPFAAKSNVKPAQETPQVKPEERPQPPETKKAIPETHKASAAPKEVVPLPSPKAKPMKPVKKVTPKNAADDDLEKILQSVKETAKTKEAAKPKEVKTAAAKAAKSDNYDPSVPLSISEKDAIRNQFIQCWNVPAGAKNAKDLVVTLRVILSEDGSVNDVKLAQDEDRYGWDTFFRTAADSALRAVRLCSPLKNLPPDKYGAWRDMELTFDPKEML